MRRKMILALMLAIVSSAWMTNEASNWCMPSVRTLTNPWIEVNGTFQAEGFPCEPEEICPTCLTIVLVTSEKTYYLVTDDGQLIEYLDTIPLGTKATVSGIPFEHGSYDYIQVSHIEPDQISQLPSLCDEWNVLHEPFECTGPYCYLETDIYRLKGDTGISIFIDMPVTYYKLEKNGQYIGALHEGNNRDIYYVPANSQNAYLLYAFNAQVGDELENVWLGGETEKEDCTNVHNATVIAISDSNPRIFTLEIIPFTSYEGMEVYPYWMEWIEGVGMSDGPVGAYDSNKLCPSAADLGVFTLLCAYKDGEQVYSSPKAQKYGCEFNGIPSTKPYHLCDEWNVLEISNVTCGYCEEYRTYNFHLTTDTVIGGLLYSQLIKDGAYKGALREGNNRDIYCVPAGCSQEYLLYAFNAQEGDSLKNIWVGGHSSWIPDVRSAIVSEIKQTTPRTIELEVHYYEAPDAYEESIRNLTWIEGIGMPFGPMGAECSIFNGCADSRAKLLLCAYKNGEQVYVSEMGEQYGCEYNYNPNETPTDTIPLYAQDDPGSSTVDPVDPNQVVATLNGNQLTIHENMGVDITYSLNHEAPAQMPSQYKAPLSNTFRDEVTIQITQSGEYLLQLTNPSWGYTIFGQFYYAPQGIDQIESSSLQGGDRGRLILLNGQILILRGEKTYTLQGQEVK